MVLNTVVAQTDQNQGFAMMLGITKNTIKLFNWNQITSDLIWCNGGDVPPERDFNLCTSWLDTFSIIASEAGKIPNPATPNVTFGKRTFFEILVNFDEVKTPGFRHSWWLMPATNNTPDRGAVVINDSGSFLDNTAYDGRVNAKNGVEIDIYEYEHIPSFEQTLLMKEHIGSRPRAAAW